MRTFFKRNAYIIADAAIAIFMLVPSGAMLFGFKSIPGIVLESAASVGFSYLWVGCFFLSALLLLCGVLGRRSAPLVSFYGERVGWPGMAFGVLVYAVSAAVAFGVTSGLITIGICAALIVACLKAWATSRLTTSRLSNRKADYHKVDYRQADHS